MPCGLRFTAISGRPLLVGVDQRGTGQNMAHMHEDPREFFLVIDASGVTIETLPDCAYLCHHLTPTSPSVKKFLGSVMGD